MFKLALLLVLSICVARFDVGVARPGYLHLPHHHHLDYPLLHHHHEPLHVAKVVHVPAAVSHQSSTVIHTVPHTVIHKPLVVPVVKTIVHPVAPIIKAFHPTPLLAPLHYDPFPHHLHHHHGHFDHHPFDHHHFH